MKNILFAFTVLALSARADVVKLELPQETAAYKRAPGADLVNAQCLTCHSADYISTQPPMPRAFWKGSVEKMIGKYGAPIPTNQVDTIINYLAKNYGTETSAPTPEPATAKAAAPGNDVNALLTYAGCINCHDVNQKKVGPAFKEVAKKYQGNAEGLAKVSHQITNGGVGQWGTQPMPAFDSLSPVEVKTLAEWVLSQK